jgi:hypothetical protein
MLEKITVRQSYLSGSKYFSACKESDYLLTIMNKDFFTETELFLIKQVGVEVVYI